MSLSTAQPILGSHHITPHPNVFASQVIHVPHPMLHEIEVFANSVERSVSACIEQAWLLAGKQAGTQTTHETARLSPLTEGVSRTVSIELSMSTWLELTLEAERLDRSRSWLLRRAWLAARRRILHHT